VRDLLLMLYELDLVFESKESCCWWHRADVHARDLSKPNVVGHLMNGEKGTRYRIMILERAR
jgi:hypothetical protein